MKRLGRAILWYLCRQLSTPFYKTPAAEGQTREAVTSFGKPLYSLPRDMKKCYEARSNRFYVWTPCIQSLPIEEALQVPVSTQNGTSQGWCKTWSGIKTMPPGISASLIVPPKIERVRPRREHVGPRSWNIRCTRDLVMLQAGQNAGVTL